MSKKKTPTKKKPTTAKNLAKSVAKAFVGFGKPKKEEPVASREQCLKIICQLQSGLRTTKHSKLRKLAEKYKEAEKAYQTAYDELEKKLGQETRWLKKRASALEGQLKRTRLAIFNKYNGPIGALAVAIRLRGATEENVSKLEELCKELSEFLSDDIPRSYEFSND